MELRELALIHIRADGPVSFKSIAAYCVVQYNGVVEHHVMADVLTGLIRSGEVGLYDDGETFVGLIER